MPTILDFQRKEILRLREKAVWTYFSFVLAVNMKWSDCFQQTERRNCSRVFYQLATHKKLNLNKIEIDIVWT